MADQEPALEEQVRRITSEIHAASRPLPMPGPGRGGGNVVEVQVDPDGCVAVRIGTPESLCLLGSGSTKRCRKDEEPEDRCYDRPRTYDLPHVVCDAETEERLGRLMKATGESRDRLLERLWERVLQRDLAGEAERYEEEVRRTQNA